MVVDVCGCCLRRHVQSVDPTYPTGPGQQAHAPPDTYQLITLNRDRRRKFRPAIQLASDICSSGAFGIDPFSLS